MYPLQKLLNGHTLLRNGPPCQQQRGSATNCMPVICLQSPKMSCSLTSEDKASQTTFYIHHPILFPQYIWQTNFKYFHHAFFQNKLLHHPHCHTLSTFHLSFPFFLFFFSRFLLFFFFLFVFNVLYNFCGRFFFFF